MPKTIAKARRRRGAFTTLKIIDAGLQLQEIDGAI